MQTKKINKSNVDQTNKDWLPLKTQQGWLYVCIPIALQNGKRDLFCFTLLSQRR